MPLEEIGGAYAREDLVEIISEHVAPIYSEQLFGIAIEENEFEVADLACFVVHVVIENDGIGAGFRGRYKLSSLSLERVASRTISVRRRTEIGRPAMKTVAAREPAQARSLTIQG